MDHAQHHGAAAPGPVAPERLFDSAPERLVGHSRGGVDPEARTPAGRPASQGQTSTNADIVVQHGDERKAFLTLRAQAALLGFELIELGASTYLLARWGMSREMTDLRTVAEMLRRIGGGR